MLLNSLEIFKDHDRRMARFAGHGKIFFNEFCTGTRASYSVDHINRFFAKGYNDDHIQERMLFLMEALQVRDPEVFGQYEYAEREYPELYQLLVDGLSDDTLKKIRELDVSVCLRNQSPLMGKRFVEKLLEDKYGFAPSVGYEPSQLTA